MTEQLSDKKELDLPPQREVLGRLGESALNAISEQSKKFGNFTSENTKNYLKDRSKENLKFLEEVGDKHFVELYQDIIEQFPQLKIVKLRDRKMDDDNASFCYTGKSEGEYYPEIDFNFSNPESYIIDPNKTTPEELSNTDERLGRKYSIKRLAFEVGADWRDCMKNRRLIADEIFLHEFGHAYDFIENYLRLEYENIEGTNRGARTLYNASRRKVANREEYEMQSPDDGLRYLLRSSDKWRQAERRLQAMGINNYEEYQYARHQYYRDQPDEAYADRFAYDYVIEHFDDYFTTDEPSPTNDKVYVDYDREIHLDPDFVHILGLKQGLGVQIQRLKDGQAIKQTSGFLATNVYVGKNLYLYEKGDPKDPGDKWRICLGISDIWVKPVRDEKTDKIKRYVFFADQDGVEYHISRTQESPTYINSSFTEMVEDLGLKSGDKIQLIKHLPLDDARDLLLEDVEDEELHRLLYGRIEKSNNSIAISTDNSNADDFRYSLDSPITRKWKTYFIDDYEVIPLPKSKQF